MNPYDKMRDALMQVSLSCSACPRHNCKGCTRPFASFMPTVRKALSLPRRNCDVGTADEQTERFNDFCESNMQHYKDMFGDGLDGWDCKENCPVGKMIDCGKAVADRCQLAWAQMPYTQEKKGKTNA